MQRSVPDRLSQELMQETYIRIREPEAREWKIAHSLLMGMITNPLTAVPFTAALAKYTAALFAQPTATESKEEIPTSPPNDEKPTDSKTRNKMGYERVSAKESAASSRGKQQITARTMLARKSTRF